MSNQSSSKLYTIEKLLKSIFQHNKRLDQSFLDKVMSDLTQRGKAEKPI